jgi:hypothetical protein
MKLNRRYPATIAFTATLCFGALALADDLSLNWFTTAGGGGATFSTGGDFSLGATLGQPAAETLTGGDFTLHGGFWAGAHVCGCPTDVNDDAKSDGRDIGSFISCLTSVGGCSCADLNADTLVDVSDIQAFVDTLLVDHPCP